MLPTFGPDVAEEALPLLCFLKIYWLALTLVENMCLGVSTLLAYLIKDK